MRLFTRFTDYHHLILLSTCLCLIGYVDVRAQNDDFNYSYSSSVYMGSNGDLPFWFYSNVDGKVEPNDINFINEFNYTTTLVDFSKFTLKSGGNVVYRLSEDNSLHVTELYGSAKLGAFRFDGGRFRQPIGSNNHDLSVGSMMISHNAIPLYKVSLSNPDFVNVPWTDGFLEYKGLYTHGWFSGDRFIDNPFIHQKFLYLRVSIGKFSGDGGFVHNVVWGGTKPDGVDLSQSFEDYIRVVLGRGASKDDNANEGEEANVLGNSVAAYDFAATYRFSTFTLSLTRLFYLEDKVSTRFRSPWDGVWGGNLVMRSGNNWIKAVTYEHINTKNQDAKSFELIGRRDYYDNFLYQSGWTHEGRVLGIPLILFDRQEGTIVNNVLIGHHLGLKGHPAPHFSYKSLVTYSRNYGVQKDWIQENGDVIPREQFRKDQYSLLLKFNYDLRRTEGLSLNLSLGADLGELYEDNLGIMLGLTWSNALSY